MLFVQLLRGRVRKERVERRDVAVPRGVEEPLGGRFLGFDAFGDDGQFQAASQRDDGVDDNFCIVAFAQVANERAVDFQCIDGELPQIGQA